MPLVPVPADLQDMPIYELAAFPADSLDAYNAGAADHDHAYFYSRYANPTIGALEVQVARLEQAEASIVFASGMAAIAATLLSLLRTGDHVVVTDDLFVTTRELFTLELPRFGIDVSMVDPLDTPGIEAAMTARTRVIYAEVFSNPLLKVLDITSVAQIAHRAFGPAGGGQHLSFSCPSQASRLWSRSRRSQCDEVHGRARNGSRGSRVGTGRPH